MVAFSMNLPEDILQDILVRLPLKSVMRCRSTCKNWCALLTDPSFLSLHLNYQLNNQTTPNLVIDDDNNKKLRYIDFDELPNEAITLNTPDSAVPVEVRGSCNGLICLSDERATSVSIWNPATSEHLKLPSVNLQLPIQSRKSDFVNEYVIGFGYDPNSNEYKFVRIEYIDATMEGYAEYVQVMVYTLGTRSWRKIDDKPPLPFAEIQNINTVSLVNRSFHFAGSRFVYNTNFTEESSFITSFSFNTEKFQEIPLPDNDKFETHKFGVLQGCISTCICFSNEVKIDIWLMKDYGRKESWVRLFSIRPPTILDNLYTDLRPIHFSKYITAIVLYEEWQTSIAIE